MTSANPAARIPVTVVTGFLGAGKTTLLRHLLLQSGQKLAVLVNEFGEVGIDGDLLRRCGFCPEDEVEGRLIELANGCLCCTVQEDFLPTMQGLLARSDDLDGIVVETSGLALPLPLVEAFQWPEIRTRTSVNGVVTVVDGESLAAGHVVADPGALEAQRLADPSLDHVDDIEGLFDDQLKAADLVLISRADCLSPEAVAGIEERLRPRVRPGTVVLTMERGNLDPAVVLGIASDHEPVHHAQDHGHAHHDHEDHDHDHAHHDHHHVPMQSVALALAGVFDRTELEEALRQQIRDQVLIRVKGQLMQPDRQHPLQIQAVGPRLESWYERRAVSPTADGDLASPEPGVRIVALGLQVDAAALEQALLLSRRP